MEKTKQNEIILLSDVVNEINSHLPGDFKLDFKIDNYITLQGFIVKHSRSMCSQCKALHKILLATFFKKALTRITSN